MTTSYPAVGVGGFTPDQWSLMFQANDAIIDDYGGNNGAISLNNSTDTATIQPVRIQVNGYTLDVDVATQLSIPPSTGSTVTYCIGALYDPALNVAQGSGDPTPGYRTDAGPCRLVAVTTVDVSGGKAYAPMYTIVRAPSQLLTAATLTDLRRWSGPIVTVNTDAARGYPTNFGSMPRGSVMFQAIDPNANGANLWVRDVNAAGTGLTWKSLLNDDMMALPILSDKVAQDTAPQFYRYGGGMIGMKGTVKRSNGNHLINPGDGQVTLANVATKYAPLSVRRFPSHASGDNGTVTCNVGVDETGRVFLYPPSTAVGSITWVDLSAIHYRAGV